MTGNYDNHTRAHTYHTHQQHLQIDRKQTIHTHTNTNNTRTPKHKQALRTTSRFAEKTRFFVATWCAKLRFAQRACTMLRKSDVVVVVVDVPVFFQCVLFVILAISSSCCCCCCLGAGYCLTAARDAFTIYAVSRFSSVHCG